MVVMVLAELAAVALVVVAAEVVAVEGADCGALITLFISRRDEQIIYNNS